MRFVAQYFHECVLHRWVKNSKVEAAIWSVLLLLQVTIEHAESAAECSRNIVEPSTARVLQVAVRTNRINLKHRNISCLHTRSRELHLCDPHIVACFKDNFESIWHEFNSALFVLKVVHAGDAAPIENIGYFAATTNGNTSLFQGSAVSLASSFKAIFEVPLSRSTFAQVVRRGSLLHKNTPRGRCCGIANAIHFNANALKPTSSVVLFC
mmetsp:Transcript_21370/g.41900  ORF Transcript_21370/g.41900 Transcript_21370/m.41900 type:complete len:210 (+) Transcript_21370:2565-3194(+)